MTCRPPLYMGPEYIKYFSDKTIDVSGTLNISPWSHTFNLSAHFLRLLLKCFDTWLLVFLLYQFSFTDEELSVPAGLGGLYTCEIQSNLRLYDIGSTGGAAERQPCHLDCWILRQLVLRLPVLCSSLCKPLSEVSKTEWPKQQVHQTSSQDVGFSCNWKRHGMCCTQ